MIYKILGFVTGNPWVLIALFAVGFIAGGAGAWHIQGLKITAVQAEFDGFVASTKAQGEAAKKIADEQIVSDKLKKELSDHEHEITLAALRADNKRLRNARAAGRFPPAPAPGARDPETICFDRTLVERAIQQLDSEVSGLVAEGDENTLSLNDARRWAVGIRKELK